MKLKALLFKPFKFFLFFRALKEAVDPQPLHEVRAEALYQAEHDLHKAELTTERALAERDMLKARVARIRAEIEGRRPSSFTDLRAHTHTAPPGTSLPGVTVAGVVSQSISRDAGQP